MKLEFDFYSKFSNLFNFKFFRFKFRFFSTWSYGDVWDWSNFGISLVFYLFYYLSLYGSKGSFLIFFSNQIYKFFRAKSFYSP